jgi:ligand-binding sensor domain-containing protein
MTHKERLKRWLASTCGIFFVCAATAALTNSDWSVHIWQSDDGLPNNKVTGIAQTPDGYLWIATPTRLSRFDGNKFEIISRDTFAPGTSQRTSTLLRSRDGGLWLAMDHGPIIYAKAGATKFFTKGLPDEIVQSLVEDGNGALWITYRGGSVCQLNDEKISRFSTTNGLPSWAQCSLACDNKNQLWFAKGGEIGIFHDGRFESRFQITAPTTAICLAAARAGGIWICAGHELLKLDAAGEPKKNRRVSTGTRRRAADNFDGRPPRRNLDWHLGQRLVSFRRRAF